MGPPTSRQEATAIARANFRANHPWLYRVYRWLRLI